MTELPKGWAETTLGEIASLRGEKVSPALMPDAPFIGLQDIEPNTSKVLNVGKGSDVKSSVAKFGKGDVLYSRLRPYLNKVTLAEFDGIASAEILVLQPTDATEGEFVRRRIMTPEFLDFAAMLDKGDRPRVNYREISEFPIFLPPLPEQKRIVAKVDGLTARTARARTDFARIPTLIARYKQRILALAFAGELTASWRLGNFGKLPTAEETLSVIEGDKEQFSENALKLYLDKQAKGIKATKPRKLTVPDPFTDEQNKTLWKLPEKWQWLQIGSFSFVTKLAGFEYTDYVTYEESGDLKVLKAENSGPNGFKQTDFSKIRSETVENLERSFLFGGELLVVFVGAGVGQVALVPGGERYFLGPNIGMARPYSNATSSRYLELFLRSENGKKLLLLSSKAVAQPSISMGAIRATPVALPSLEEQNEIIRSIDSAFNWLDRMAVDHTAASKLLPKLDAAILAKAFRGELVAQDPNDEPASVLLERIQAERAAAPKKSRDRRSVAVSEVVKIQLPPVQVYVSAGPVKIRETRGGQAMTKSRKDDDVMGQPYLAGLIKKGRAGTAQDLFKASNLPVADFYKQLAWEIEHKHIRDDDEKLEAL